MIDRASRYLELLGGLDPIEVLTATPGHIVEWLESVDVAALDEPLASTGPTARDHDDQELHTPRELLAHLADVELTLGFHLRQLVALPGVELQSVDHHAWSTRYRRLDPSLALEAFRALRAWNLALLSGFDLDDWLAEGFHPERGFESSDLMVRQAAGHDLATLIRLGIVTGGASTRSTLL